MIAATWTAIFFGLYVLLVQNSGGRRLDEWLFNAVPRRHSILFRLAGAAIGSEPLWVLVGLGAAVMVGLRKGRLRQLVVGAGMAAASVALGELFKRVLLSRPSAGAATAASNSFPSGHVVVVTAAVVAVGFVAGPRWRRVVLVAGSLLCVLVGMSTMVQQWHRPSDVLSAYALVAACAYAGAAVLRSWSAVSDPSDSGRERARP